MLAFAGFIVFFVALWCVAAKLLALLGWQRLAADFRQVELPSSRQFGFAQAKVGVVGYTGIITAGVSPEGLSLRVSSLFRVGHPPLLIPWSAIEPLQTSKFLWNTTYYTTVHTSAGGRVNLRFSNKQLVEAAAPWLRLGV